MSELDYSDKITITITKVHSYNEPSHWEVELDNGSFATGPNFYSIWDEALSLITGDYGDVDSLHNDWVDFDANKKENK